MPAAHREQFWVQYRAQGHLDMWTGEPKNPSSDTQITGRPAHPHELQPPQIVD